MRLSGISFKASSRITYCQPPLSEPLGADIEEWNMIHGFGQVEEFSFALLFGRLASVDKRTKEATIRAHSNA